MAHGSTAGTLAKPTEADDRPKRLRSPAYPFINLEAAVKRAKQFYDKEGRNMAFLKVAIKHWGYEEKSSGGQQTAAALISFGLMRDEGTADKRKVQLTQDALRIVLDQRTDSAEREAALKKAALAPKIHQELWKKWNWVDDRPSVETLKHTLILDWEPPFNENTVDGFIKEFSDTIAFAKFSSSDRVPSSDEDTKGEEKTTVKVGDFVQWESQGMLQFHDPKRVMRFSDDGKFLFVEGVNTGIPVSEVEIEEAPVTTHKVGAILPVKREVRRPAGGSANMRQDVFSVTEGDVVLSWPASLSAKSISYIKGWLKIAENKISDSQDNPENKPDPEQPQD